MSTLFTPLIQRGLTLPNRIVVSPMCQYSSADGLANDWHFAHLAQFALGGAGVVLTEATAVLPEGRISPEDLGIWSDVQIAPLARIARFIRSQGSVAGIQLAHAGRKASTWRPWAVQSGAVPIESGGWQVVGPSGLAFSATYPQPRALSLEEVRAVPAAFAAAARRALQAGFQIAEVHAAHGYLLHQFLSPLANQRDDDYGGSFENRIRLTLETVQAVRAVWPDELPVWVRVSATDWADGGWTVDETVALARRLKPLGVDLVDVSSGGMVPTASIPVAPGYQVPFAERVQREAGMPAGAVGLITDPAQAEAIVASGQAEVVLLARELLRDPRWPQRAAQALGVATGWPAQYLRAAPAGSPQRNTDDYARPGADAL